MKRKTIILKSKNLEHAYKNLGIHKNDIKVIDGNYDIDTFLKSIAKEKMEPSIYHIDIHGNNKTNENGERYLSIELEKNVIKSESAEELISYINNATKPGESNIYIIHSCHGGALNPKLIKGNAIISVLTDADRRNDGDIAKFFYSKIGNNLNFIDFVSNNLLPLSTTGAKTIFKFGKEITEISHSAPKGSYKNKDTMEKFLKDGYIKLEKSYKKIYDNFSKNHSVITRFSKKDNYSISKKEIEDSFLIGLRSVVNVEKHNGSLDEFFKVFLANKDIIADYFLIEELIPWCILNNYAESVDKIYKYRKITKISDKVDTNIKEVISGFYDHSNSKNFILFTKLAKEKSVINKLMSRCHYQEPKVVIEAIKILKDKKTLKKGVFHTICQSYSKLPKIYDLIKEMESQGLNKLKLSVVKSVSSSLPLCSSKIEDLFKIVNLYENNTQILLQAYYVYKLLDAYDQNPKDFRLADIKLAVRTIIKLGVDPTIRLLKYVFDEKLEFDNDEHLEFVRENILSEAILSLKDESKKLTSEEGSLLKELINYDGNSELSFLKDEKEVSGDSDTDDASF